ncbi:hypothetical protein M405DRAFT_804485 [Rhizopogon salebrosus TDB-379]|nr:hypothetical protein M405DRAFT_804485 [Rhizopogon salebrosus TDB-379]
MKPHRAAQAAFSSLTHQLPPSPPSFLVSFCSLTPSCVFGRQVPTFVRRVSENPSLQLRHAPCALSRPTTHPTFAWILFPHSPCIQNSCTERFVAASKQFISGIDHL